MNIPRLPEATEPIRIEIEATVPEATRASIIASGKRVEEYVLDVLREHGLVELFASIETRGDEVDHCALCAVKLEEPNTFGVCGHC